MQIAWLVPCAGTYKVVTRYFQEIAKFSKIGWRITVFNNEKISGYINGVHHLDLILFGNDSKFYNVVHYFLDNCDNCTNMNSKAMHGQRIYISNNIDKDFRDIIFKYYEEI